jgi:uncharacterized protein YcgI (DUF1989 family)
LSLRSKEAVISERHVVPGGSGFAAAIASDSVLRVVDIDGKQVGDLVLFVAEDPTERFSQANTRKLENTIHLRQGSQLWSTRCRPLATITKDSVQEHDILSSACSPYDYPIRFGIRGHRSCLANLVEALSPYGIKEALIPDPINVFMHQELSGAGTFTVAEPLSKAGDSIELLARFDSIFAISACPQDQNACNGWKITDLLVEYEPLVGRSAGSSD